MAIAAAGPLRHGAPQRAGLHPGRSTRRRHRSVRSSSLPRQGSGGSNARQHPSSSTSSPAVAPPPLCPPPSGTLQQKFLAEHIKIANKTNNLGDAVKVDVEGAKVIITTTVAFPKRYFKYLAKKYLKKNQLREYLRVIASSKAGYELRYFQLGGEGDEE